MTVQVDDLTLAAAPPIERRRARRFRFQVLMPALLGRGDALILDISAEGARLMHFAAHPLDSRVRLVFSYGRLRFAVNARVLASRVIGLGDGPSGATSYESRLRFLDCTPEMALTLHDIIEKIECERVRSGPPEEGVQYFLRCRLQGHRWSKTWTRERDQPADGFTVPAKLSDGEVGTLCDVYDAMDAAGRDLIRATAAIAE